MKKKEEIKRIIFVILIIVSISLFLEIFVFNVNSFRLVGKNYQSKTVSVENCETQGLLQVEENQYQVTEDTAYIRIKDINQECGTMYLDMQKSEDSNKEIELKMFYSDETSQGLRSLPTKIIYTDLEQSKYNTLQLSGKVNEIVIQIENQKEETIQIDSIQFNQKIPFEFHWIRFFILNIILFCLYGLFFSKFLDQKLDLKDQKQYLVTYVLGCVTCLIFSIYTLNASSNTSLIVNLEKTIYHNYIYDVEYTRALSNGSLKLLMEVDEKLLDLENPYDETERIAVGFNQIYDYVYYNGAYYVYFSILPQLIMVPFHILTGAYLNSTWLMIFFMILGVISTIKLVIAVFEYWFPESKFRMFLLATLLMLFSNTLLYTMGTPAVYELVAVLGYWLVTGGIYRILIALKDSEKIHYKKLMIGCLMLACAVSARPNLIIISLFVLPIFLVYFIRLLKKKERRRDLIRFVLAIGIPYLSIGIILMALNYVRFGSITEFGAIYQLTSNDMAKLGYRIGTIPIGIWHYFFNPADISLEFPFINTRPNMPQYMGFYGTGFAGVGIFMLMPICFLIFFLPVLRRQIKEYYPNLWFLIIDALIIAFISAIVVTLVGASYYRYSLDFIWLVAIVGVCLMLVVMQRLKQDKLMEKLAEGILTVLTIFTICITLGVSVQSEGKLFKRMNPETYYAIKEAICFWE